MSYILDALKKSESERQRQDAPGFADVPAQVQARGTPKWIWLLAGLLLVNALVVGALLLRGFFAVPASPVAREQPATAPAAIAAPSSTRQPPAAPPVTADISANRPPAPLRTPVRSAAPPAADSQRPSASRASQQQPRPSALAANSANLPTLLDLQANGTLQLPELHLDIHVFSQAPQDRFVFINMSKYREAARLADGPLVKEIVPDGVVLEYEGNTFLLPRD